MIEDEEIDLILWVANSASEFLSWFSLILVQRIERYLKESANHSLTISAIQRKLGGKTRATQLKQVLDSLDSIGRIKFSKGRPPHALGWTSKLMLNAVIRGSIQSATTNLLRPPWLGWLLNY
jgi:hypothetical protein